MRRELWIKTLKIAVGSALAVFIANVLQVEFATSAGIVTLLTIQDTRRSTVQLALKRILSFFVTILLTVIFHSLFGMSIVAFGIFMFSMVCVSYYFKWEGAISVNAVIGTHVLLMDSEISIFLLLNEFYIVVIGTVIALVLNSHIPDKRKEIIKDIHYIEEELKSILKGIAKHLRQQEKLKLDKLHLSNLIKHIDDAADKAFANSDNTLKEHSKYYIEYLAMRRQQCIILIHFYRLIVELEEIPNEAEILSEFLYNLATEYNIKNDVTKRMQQLGLVMEQLQALPLPVTQMEFEGRAVLFQVIKELEEFLRVKREFANGVTKEQQKIYW